MNEEKIKVLTVQPMADWFQNEWKEIDVKKYIYFSMHAREMIWALHGHYYYNGFHNKPTYDSFPLAPEFDAKSLIGKLDIREIIGNNYRKPEQLFSKEIKIPSSQQMVEQYDKFRTNHGLLESFGLLEEWIKSEINIRNKS